MQPDNHWQLEGSIAKATIGSLPVVLDLAAPASGCGLGAGHNGSAVWGWSPEGRQPPQLAEAYVRGNDLIADYAPADDFPFKTQVYWRIESLGGLPEVSVLSLILSVHTFKLDTHPVYAVESKYLDASIKSIDQDGYLGTRIDRAGVTLVETIHPSDQLGSGGPACEQEQGVSWTRWRLFDHFLEKGVIRRARLSLATVDGAAQDSQLVETCQRLRGIPSPLTT